MAEGNKLNLTPYQCQEKRTQVTPPEDTLEEAVDVESPVKALVNPKLHSYVSTKD